MSSARVDSSSENMFVLNLRPSYVELDDDEDDVYDEDDNEELELDHESPVASSSNTRRRGPRSSNSSSASSPSPPTSSAASSASHTRHNRAVRFARPPPPTSTPPSVPHFSNEEIEQQLEFMLRNELARHSGVPDGVVGSAGGSTASSGTGSGTFIEHDSEQQPSLVSLLLRAASSSGSSTTAAPGAPAAAAAAAAAPTTTKPSPFWATLHKQHQQQQQQPPAYEPVQPQLSPTSTHHVGTGGDSAAASYLTGGTIRLMQGVLAQKRAVTAPQQLRTGMPAHLDIASASAAMALDVLALSHETEAMNDECLRVGIWNYVVPSLMMLRDDETAKFIQIVLYLMQKSSSLMMRGMDFLLYLLGYYRAWEVKSTKEAQRQSYAWTKEQRSRIYPNAVAALFEADHCDALVVAARNFMKEQSSLHVRLATLQRCFLKTYTKAAGVPHWRDANRKLVKHSFDLNLHYWERQQRAMRKRR